MKTVILAGGMGTRLSEYTRLVPKPMVEIGEKPMLWHIMNIYASYGFNEFIIALGYRGEVVKEYFLNYYAINSDFEVDLSTGKIAYLNSQKADWKVNLVDTGQNSMTGGRVGRLRNLLKGETFMLTYGDAVSDINLKKLLEFHKAHGKKATVTSVRPPARFGEIITDKTNAVKSFQEKAHTASGLINGGFFVFEPEMLNYIEHDATVLEREPLEGLTRDNQLMAYFHEGFWQCMDTIRDKNILEELWSQQKPPWKIW